MSNVELERECMYLQDSYARVKGIVTGTKTFYKLLGEEVPAEVLNIQNELREIPKFIFLDTKQELQECKNKKIELEKKILPYHRYAHDKLYPDNVLYDDDHITALEHELGKINW